MTPPPDRIAFELRLPGTPKGVFDGTVFDPTVFDVFRLTVVVPFKIQQRVVITQER